MAIEIKVKFEPVRSRAFGDIGAAYMSVGTSTDHPARMVLIQNFTDADLMFSFDGIEDHFPIKKSSSFILDVSSNKTVDAGFFIEQGTKLYVKEIGTPTSGSVYFTAFYGEDN
jgi:hypothetical protein